MPCLALPCALWLVQLPLAGQSQQRNQHRRRARKSVTRPHKEIIHLKTAKGRTDGRTDRQWNCLNSYDDNNCSLSAHFVGLFRERERGDACPGCVDLAAPDKRRKLANASAAAVVVAFLLHLFSFVRFLRLY